MSAQLTREEAFELIGSWRGEYSFSNLVYGAPVSRGCVAPLGYSATFRATGGVREIALAFKKWSTSGERRYPRTGEVFPRRYLHAMNPVWDLARLIAPDARTAVALELMQLWPRLLKGVS